MLLGLIGCGLVGRKRAGALAGHQLVVCADVVPELASALASEQPGCKALASAEHVLRSDDVELVLVCTTNDALAPLTLAALEAGKHVLVEKPGGRSLADVERMQAASARYGRAVRVGFNHRYHPGLQQAHELFVQGALGELMYIRGRYGHGGRVGYETEWRANKERAGGGELLDQGSHLIDLARWFAGDFSRIDGHVSTSFWPMEVEDNAFMSLRTASGATAWLHASWTEWKNLFCFEVFGRTGKLQIDGLGGSYGPERLTWYRMLPEMGPPEVTVYEYAAEDGSWAAELAAFTAALQRDPASAGNLADAAAVFLVAERLYGEPAR